MLRLFALTLATALLAAPACAQRGGSRSGAVGRSAPSFHSNFSYAAPRSFASAPGYAGNGFRNAAPAYRGSPSAARPAYYNGSRGRQPYIYRGGQRSGTRSYGYAYPYEYGNYVSITPYELGYPDFFGYGDEDAPVPDVDATGYAEPPYADGGDMQPPYASAQPYPDQPYPYQPYPPQPEAPYAYESEPPQPSAAAAAAPVPEDAVTIIFKDGHTEQIQNYAITRTTLYVAGRRVHDIPLELIDLAATEKVNRDAGVDFALPQFR